MRLKNTPKWRGFLRARPAGGAMTISGCGAGLAAAFGLGTGFAAGFGAGFEVGVGVGFAAPDVGFGAASKAGLTGGD